jgi:hypothetical protein
MFYLPYQCQRCHHFKYFGQHIETFSYAFHMLDWLNLDQHALDADPDPPK